MIQILILYQWKVKDNPVVKSPHGNAVQVPTVNAVKSSKGSREEYIHNIQELKMEVAKTEAK